MKRFRSRLVALFIVSSLLLTACNFFPEPVSLIQAPKQAKAAIEVDGNLLQKARGSLPKGTSLAVADEPVGIDSVLQTDFGNDGTPEAIAFYKSNVNADQLGVVILQKENEVWNKISTIPGTGYDISWGSIFDVTGDGKPELLLGWKVGVSAGNILDIYSWEQNGFKRLAQLNYHKLELVQESNIPSLAVWKRTFADVYEVDVLKWEKNKFISNKELFPSYFLKVAEYYEKRTKEVPDVSYYWYYLANALNKANKPENAIEAINKGFELDITTPTFPEYQKLKTGIELKLAQKANQDVQFYVPEADITVNIPRSLFPYISIEGAEGMENEYIVNVNITDKIKKGLLFAVEVYSKDFIGNPQELNLQIIDETDLLVYGVKRSKENPFMKETDSQLYGIYEDANNVLEEVISSVRLGSTFPKHKSMSDELLVQRVLDAYKKFSHVQMGGEMKSGIIETFSYDHQDYRYLGEDINTIEKLTHYLSDFYTPEAIQSYVKNAKIIEEKGKLAQPNADGGSLLNRQNASVMQVKDLGIEKQFDLKVPVGNSLTYEIINVVFKKTEEGWRISSAPGTF